MGKIQQARWNPSLSSCNAQSHSHHQSPRPPTPNPNPTPEQTIPVPKHSPMNVPKISPTMPTVPFRVQRVPIVSPTRPPVQFQRVPLKYPGGTTIPARKTIPPWPVCPILNTWRHDPHLWHTCAAAVSQLVIQEHPNNIYHSVTGQFETYDKINLWHTKRWITRMFNELGRLASGVGDRMTSGTDTIFIHKNQVPAGRKATYANAVCDYEPLKYDPYCVWLAVGGDRLIYPGDTRGPTASLLASKTIFNVTISTLGAWFFVHTSNIIF